jgi:hypothetical protein
MWLSNQLTGHFLLIIVEFHSRPTEKPEPFITSALPTSSRKEQLSMIAGLRIPVLLPAVNPFRTILVMKEGTIPSQVSILRPARTISPVSMPTGQNTAHRQHALHC